MGPDRTMVLTVAAELLAFAVIVLAVNKVLDRLQRRRREDRQGAAVTADLDVELAALLGTRDGETP